MLIAVLAIGVIKRNLYYRKKHFVKAVARRERSVGSVSVHYPKSISTFPLTHVGVVFIVPIIKYLQQSGQ